MRLRFKVQLMATMSDVETGHALKFVTTEEVSKADFDRLRRGGSYYAEIVPANIEHPAIESEPDPLPPPPPLPGSHSEVNHG